MTIIHDAIKKAEMSYNKTEGQQVNKKGRHRFKVYLIYGLVVCLGFFVANIVFNFFFRRSQINTDLAEIQFQASGEQAVNSKQELPVKEEASLADIPSRLNTSGEQAAPLILNGVFYSGNEGSALINNRIVKEGDIIEGATIKKITSDKVTLEKNGVFQDLAVGRRGYFSSEEIPEKTTQDKNPQKAPGGITEGAVSEIVQPQELSGISASRGNVKKYTVQYGDTLQKIALKFYGTASEWVRIYEANKTKLKIPDRIYSGQVIDIPLQESNSN